MSQPRPLDTDLFVGDHPPRLPGGVALGTRSTLIRLSDNRLWLHSPGPSSPASNEWFAQHGSPGVIVAKNAAVVNRVIGSNEFIDA